MVVEGDVPAPQKGTSIPSPVFDSSSLPSPSHQPTALIKNTALFLAPWPGYPKRQNVAMVFLQVYLLGGFSPPRPEKWWTSSIGMMKATQYEWEHAKNGNQLPPTSLGYYETFLWTSCCQFKKLTKAFSKASWDNLWHVESCLEISMSSVAWWGHSPISDTPERCSKPLCHYNPYNPL